MLKGQGQCQGQLPRPRPRPRTGNTRPRPRTWNPRPRTWSTGLEDPRGQGHVLEDSISGITRRVSVMLLSNSELKHFLVDTDDSLSGSERDFLLGTSRSHFRLQVYRRHTQKSYFAVWWFPWRPRNCILAHFYFPLSRSQQWTMNADWSSMIWRLISLHCLVTYQFICTSVVVSIYDKPVHK